MILDKTRMKINIVIIVKIIYLVCYKLFYWKSDPRRPRAWPSGKYGHETTYYPLICHHRCSREVVSMSLIQRTCVLSRSGQFSG